MGFTAGIILDKKHVITGVTQLKEVQLRSAYDSKMIRNIIGQLESFCFEIKLMTWKDFIHSSPEDFNVVVVAQWILNGERGPSSEKVSDNLKLNKIMLFIDNGVSFILTHHFYPEWIFLKLLDINLLESLKRGYFASKSTINLLENDNQLIQGVDSFIKKFSMQLGSDEFTYVMKENSKFNTLINKSSKKMACKSFILFGFQQMNKNSSFFIIDIHNTGLVESHSELFNILFQNTLQFITGDVKLLNTVIDDIGSFDAEYSEMVEKEGSKKQVLINKYERNPKLRLQAIKVHGLNCMACGFNFSKFYGIHGSEFIEAHHVIPLSTVSNEIEVNPQTDMIVLCSNCHRMIHRKMNSPLSLNELKNIISNNKLFTISKKDK